MTVLTSLRVASRCALVARARSTAACGVEPSAVLTLRGRGGSYDGHASVFTSAISFADGRALTLPEGPPRAAPVPL